MKKRLILLLSILYLNSYAQVSFEKGYIIDNSGNKTTCLIKNMDWNDNPTEFKYKLFQNDIPNKADINSISEFGIDNKLKYYRSSVNIDLSSDNLNDLGYVKKSQFVEKQLFLKVLIEGKASLYLYEKNNLKRFFYNIDNQPIEQLIYKRYKTTSSLIGSNNKFRQQLWLTLNCLGITDNRLKQLNYNKNDLVSLFEDYNGCQNSEFVNYEKKVKRDLFNFNIRPGIRLNTLTLENSNTELRNMHFKNAVSYRVGIESEILMPFNHRRWAILIEPTYQSFNSEIIINIGTEGFVVDEKVTAKYKSIEIPVGFRYYFYQNSESQLFLNIAYAIDINNNSKIDFETQNDIEMKSSDYMVLGIGYKFQNRYSIEYRYNLTRDPFWAYNVWQSKYTSMSLICGITLF